MYGFQESADLGSGSNGGKFGLNTGAMVTKFEFTENAGKDNAPGEAIDLTVQIGEKEFRKRFFPIEKVFGKNGEITDTNSDEYKETFAKEVNLLNGALTDVAKCFATEEEIKNALVGVNSFKTFGQALERVVKANGAWDKVPVDVFLCYQWQPKGENTRTYLELPKNVKHGSYICKSQGAGYNQTENTSGISYANEEGSLHPFTRTSWFAESAFSNLTDLGSGTEDAMGSSASSDW